MPYRVELDAPFIRVFFSGIVTGDDLLSIASELEEHERALGRIPDRLVDLSDMEKVGLTFHVVLAAARHRRAQAFPNGFRSALVAPTPHTEGFARMFLILNSNPQIELRLFATREAAEQWLGAAEGEVDLS
jgi:hypothetical protein